MRFRPRIKTIRSLKILIDDVAEDTLQEWVFDLPHPAYFDRAGSTVNFFRESVKINIAAAVSSGSASSSDSTLDYPKPGGRKREPGRYTSVRTHLPEVYGIGPRGLPGTATAERRAQAKQLSAYLLFFEQILANSFVQLANAWRLFDPAQTAPDTYFTLELSGLSGGPEGLPLSAIESLFTDTDAQQRAARLAAATETAADAQKRSQRFLDHLLARYGENFKDYTLLQRAIAPANEAQTIADKRAFLQDFLALSSQRSLGYNYTADGLWDTTAVGGLKKRIARKLGILEARQDYSDATEMFFLLEHILLRPLPEDAQQAEVLMGYLPVPDPYSFQISYVFPAEAGRFADEDFKAYTTQVLREETPAHIKYKTYWLEQDGIALFQSTFRTWLSAYASREEGAALLRRLARDELTDLLFCYCQNSNEMNASTFGIAFPNRNLEVEVIGVARNEAEDAWTATLRIHAPQRGVTYTLFDRDLQPLNLDISAGVPQEDNTPLSERHLDLVVPGLEQDQKFNIRAEKELTCGDQTFPLRALFLKEPVQVRTGIAERTVKSVCPGPDYSNLDCAEVVQDCEEIDYDTTASILICEIQAEVNYYLFLPDASAPMAGPETGAEDSNLVIQTTGLTEDTTVFVRGRRGDTGDFIEVGEVAIRVRANPNIGFTDDPHLLDFDTGTTLQLQGDDDQGNVTQANVTYTLYRREVRDREFVHHVADPPAAVWPIPLDTGDTALIHRPEVGLNELTGADSIYTPVDLPKQPAQDGAPLSFTTGNLQEDHLFVVVASKEGHETPVILGFPADNPGRAHIGAALVRPNPAVPFEVNPAVLPPNTRGRVLLPAPQTGVKYFLRYVSNGANQEAVYVHVTEGTAGEHPRKDGAGLSKVAVDMVVGPPVPQPIEVQTNNPLPGNRAMRLVGEKIQTGLQVQIGDDFEIEVDA